MYFNEVYYLVNKVYDNFILTTQPFVSEKTLTLQVIKNSTQTFGERASMAD